MHRSIVVRLARLSALVVCVALGIADPGVALGIPVPAHAAPPELFTSDAGAGTASAYTIGAAGALTAAGSPLSTGSTANNPNGVVVSPDGSYLFVTNAGADTVSVFAVNQADGTLTAASTSAAVSNIQAMEALAISPDGTHLYATGNSSGNGTPGNSRVAVFDVGAGGALTLAGPVVDTGQPSYSYAGSTAVAISPDGSHLYVTTSEPAGTSAQHGPYLQSDAVTEFPISAADGSLGAPVTVTPGAGTAPLGISVAPDGGHLYVAESNKNFIDTYAIAADGTLSGPTKTDSGSGATANPQALEVARDGRHLYVANASSGSTSSVSELPIAADGSLGTALVTADTQRAPVSLAITPDDKFVYTGDYFCSSSGCSVAEFPVQADGSLGPQVTTAATGGPGFFALAASPRQAPTAAFSAVAADAAAASTFDGSTSSDPTGTIARYDWSWGDGSSSPDGGATPSHTFASAGTYTITLTVTDDAGCSTATVSAGQTVFCNGSTSATTTQQITVGQATPTLTTHASPGVPIGGQITDTATLTGGASPTGAITFKLYGPNDPTCAGTPLQTSKAVNLGNGSYTSDPQTPATPGAYRWIASYGGDANDAAISGGCSDASEQVTVSPGSDLSVSGTGAPAAPHVGDDITYTFTIGDAGDDALGVTFSDQLPAGVSLVSATSSQGTCSGSTAISCSLGVIPQGSHAAVSIVVKATQAGLVSDTGDVSGSNFDPNTANNLATVAVQVSPAVVGPGNARPPVLTTGRASGMTQHGVVLHGTLNPGGATTAYYFEYGTSTRYGLATRQLTLSGDASQAVSALVGGLRLGTKYHFRLVAVNSAGGARGNDRTLETVGRVKPRLTFSVSPRKEVLTGADTDDVPFDFTVSGKLHLPSGVAASAGCRGRIGIRFQLGQLTINHAVDVSPTCGYDARVSFSAGGEGRTGTVRVSVSFEGNAALKADSASSVTTTYSEQGTVDNDPPQPRHAPNER